MQAIAIQQDALLEMNYALTAEKPTVASQRLDQQLSAWRALRDLRHLNSGHPNRKDHGEPRTVQVSVPRQRMTYAGIEVSFREPPVPQTPRPDTINLGKLLDGYDAEAAQVFAHLPCLLTKQISDFERLNSAAPSIQ